jgi:virulence-associated protein VagC
MEFKLPMTIPDEFLMLLGKLGEGQIDLIREMASHMVNPIQEQVNSASNLLTSRFRENFSNRLVVHHATHEEKFKKKSFEFAFCAAYRSDGRVATIVVRSWGHPLLAGNLAESQAVCLPYALFFEIFCYISVGGPRFPPSLQICINGI